jgi:hypothetical protein
MTDDQFWSIIALLDWSRAGDDEAVLAPAVDALAALGASAVTEFQDSLAKKLYALDTRAHARAIGEWAYDEEDDASFSADTFLYARCVVVANGPRLYEYVVAHPEAMPKDMEFEALLSLAPVAYERLTGEEFDHQPEVDFETFSNRVGWQPTA